MEFVITFHQYQEGNFTNINTQIIVKYFIKEQATAFQNFYLTISYHYFNFKYITNIHCRCVIIRQILNY